LIRAQARFAIGASAIRMSHLINGRRPVTADLALRPARFFDQTPLSWLNLQSRYG
jgi:addiction module HigA family antidote